MSGTCEYGGRIDDENWTVQYETTFHPPCCICLGAIASIVRYGWGAKVHRCGWLSSTQLLTDPCQYFLRNDRFFDMLPHGPLHSESNGKRIYFQERADEPLVEFTPHSRLINRVSAQSCGEGFFLLLEDGQLPSKRLSDGPRWNDTLEETGPVVSSFDIEVVRAWGGSQPLLYLPVHSSCLDLLDRFLTTFDGYSGYIQSMSQVFDIFRSRLRGSHPYKEHRVDAMKPILEREIQSLKPRSTETLRWRDIWDFGSEVEDDPDSDEEIEIQPDVDLDWNPIHQLSPEQLRHLRERQNTLIQEEEMNAIICEQLRSDPTTEQDCTPALQACAPLLFVEMLQATRFQQRLDELPQELMDQIMEHLCIPSMVPAQCNRLLSPSTWLKWLKSGDLVPYLWDFTIDANIEKEPIDWEKLYRMIVQDEPITVDHPLNGMPPGFKNRRRIWRNLQQLRPDDLHYISAREYRRMIEPDADYLEDAIPSLFLDEAEQKAERFIQEDQGYTSIKLEWVPELSKYISGGHWTVKWRRISTLR